jgi:hypothetical protein
VNIAEPIAQAKLTDEWVALLGAENVIQDAAALRQAETAT